MIAHLRGAVTRVDGNAVVVDVHGVGYRVFVPLTVLSALPAEGEQAFLHVTTVVREDDWALYGFATTEEQALFMMLTGVTGVGPKVALSMLSVLGGAALAHAIASGDTRSLTGVPGVGAKLAQRVILELGDRAAELVFASRVAAGEGGDGRAAVLDDVVEALVGLGYSRADSRRAADRVLGETSLGGEPAALIRAALAMLSKSARR
ncbi:MAG TPA: Holliday junction branch migration protein RuvA [Chthonomonadales bacterium]|nr:Holliday junction branch migration protein RuvA [Chthonomonadales bacterium]